MNISFGHSAAKRNYSDSVVFLIKVAGVTGIGECAPRKYVTGEDYDSVSKDLIALPLKRLFEQLLSDNPRKIFEGIKNSGTEKFFGITLNNNSLCVFEMAVLDWLSKSLEMPLISLLTSINESPPKNAGVKISQVLDLDLGVEEFIKNRGPFSFIKIKASNCRNENIRNVSFIRRNVPSDIPLSVDANMGWNLSDIISHIVKLKEIGVDYIEEPFIKNSWNDLNALRKETDVKIMLDESVNCKQDLVNAYNNSSIDALNVRVSKCGGLLKSIDIIKLAKELRIPFQIGVQVAECGPLINASRLLAQLYPEALTLEGGQADRFFNEFVVSPSPLFNRIENTVDYVRGYGFGMNKADYLDRYMTSYYETNADRWTDL